jgi:signal transduction histidine kinase
MQKKIIIAIILNVIVISAILGIISYFAVHESIERSLQNRLALARVVANYVEVFLNNNLGRLNDASLSGKINLKDNDWQSEKRVLENIYKYSLFTEGVFLLDKHGNELLIYPPQIKYLSNLSYINYVNQVLESGKPIISNVYTIEPIKKKVIFMMTPLRDSEGRIAGIVGGILGPTDQFINQLLQSGKIESNSYIEIIDSNEVVVASDNPSHVFQHHNHDSNLSKMIIEGKSGILECRHGFSHPNPANRPVDRLAFVPLNVAKWGVIVGQSEKDIFAPAIGLEGKFLLVVLIFIGASVIISIVVSIKVVKPLGSLISSTNKIASGDLSTPVGNVGSDEILKLSKSFDDMRKKLAESLESIKIQNIELENRVMKRTQQIRESRQKVQHLLKKIISSQEDERRRIARGLHDTILQDMLAFLIKLDVYKARPDLVSVEQIDEMRKVAMVAVDSIYTVIKDLRPSILDDFGIDASILWLLNKHLQKNGINYYCDIESIIQRRLPPEVEITLFRIVQESIINIERHANAENVFVALSDKKSFIEISIEDDGDGFDVHEVMKHPLENGRGLGIIGMKERASLLDGKFHIYSRPGEGTRVCVKIPLTAQVRHVVLLVDDDEVFVNPLAQKLKTRDFIVNTVYNGEQALSSFHEKKHDVIVLDLKMPGMHGLEVLRDIKEENKDVKVIILSGHDTDKYKEEAKKLGAFAFLKKPPDIDLLAATIMEAEEHV